MPRISVIVPVYNCELYLRRCIDSILSQDYSDYELILVDDGSTDKSGRICDEYKAKHSNITVIHQDNKKAGEARNSGMSVAAGEYYFFSDADDYIAPFALSTCMEAAEKSDAKAIIYGMDFVDKEGNTYIDGTPVTDKDVYEGEEIRDYIIPNLLYKDPETGIATNMYMSQCTMMLKASVIKEHDWKFESDSVYVSEEYYSLLNLYQYIDKVAVVHKTLYFYATVETSKSRSFMKDRLSKNNFLYDECISLCDSLDYGKDIKDRIAFLYMANLIGAIKAIVNADFSFKEKRSMIKEIVCDKQFSGILKSMNLKHEKRQRKILFLALKSKLILPIYILFRLKG